MDTTAEIYRQVINEVIDQMREEFLTGGYEESELEHLRNLWERNLVKHSNTSNNTAALYQTSNMFMNQLAQFPMSGVDLSFQTLGNPPPVLGPISYNQPGL